jgi:uncharacterized protein
MVKRNLVYITTALIFISISCKNNTPSEEKTAVHYSTEDFHTASLDGNIEKVKLALETGIQADIVDTDGKNALMLAAFNGHTEIIKILFEKGVPINKQDNDGRTALMYASTGPFPATIKFLLDKKAEINIADKVEHFTALMHAASEGQLEVVKILMENGADATLKDIDGDTAESFAVQNKHPEVAQYLAKYKNN